jgi:glycerate 2-kinase
MTSPYLLIVVNPFKGTMSAPLVAEQCGAAAEAEGVAVRVVPGSDGGDGLLDALRCAGLLLRETEHEVTGPVGRPVQAPVGWLDERVAVVESSAVVGLRLVPERERDPLRTTTVGLGELIATLQGLGASEAWVGLGGSATMDAGTGMARAWGARFVDAAGRLLTDGGGALSVLDRVVLAPPPALRVVGLVDVSNPLTGPEGARVYACQKGASARAADALMMGLDRLVQCLGRRFRPLARQSGAGAAGGLGFGILAFANGALAQGAPWVLGRVGFDRLLKGAWGLLTAEGEFDATSLAGKLTGEVLTRARRAGVPAALVAAKTAEVPRDVITVCSDGVWTPQDVQRHARTAIRRLRSLAG